MTWFSLPLMLFFEADINVIVVVVVVSFSFFSF